MAAPHRIDPTPDLGAELARFDWAQFHPWGALTCLPAMAIALGIGWELHQAAAGIIVATGTLLTGFSSFRELRGSRLLQMLLTTIGVAFAASVGTEVGRSHLAVTLLACCAGFAYGLVLVFSENASWIVLQTVIAFLIATAFPSQGWHVFSRGALVGLGGFLQVGMVLAMRQGAKGKTLREEFAHCEPSRVFPFFWRVAVPTVLRQVDHRLPVMRYAVRLALTLMLAVIIARTLHQTNSYWLPMTALLVMKPDFYRTYTNTMARVLGTFLGVTLASALTWALHPDALELFGFVLVFGWGAFAWTKVNYGFFSCVLTGYIVFLIATAGLPEVTVTANRMLDTALGSLIALGSRALAPKWDRVATPDPQAPVTAPPLSATGGHGE